MKANGVLARVGFRTSRPLVIVLLLATTSGIAALHAATLSAGASSLACIPEDPEFVGDVISADPEPIGNGVIDAPDAFNRVINDSPEPITTAIIDGPEPLNGLISDTPDPISTVIGDGPDPMFAGDLLVCVAEGNASVVQLVPAQGDANMVSISGIECVCLPIGSAISLLE